MVSKLPCPQGFNTSPMPAHVFSNQTLLLHFEAYNMLCMLVCHLHTALDAIENVLHPVHSINHQCASSIELGYGRFRPNHIECREAHMIESREDLWQFISDAVNFRSAVRAGKMTLVAEV